MTVINERKKPATRRAKGLSEKLQYRVSGDTATRRAKGLYTPKEAAKELTERAGGKLDVWLQKLVNAICDEKLNAYRVGGNDRILPKTTHKAWLTKYRAWFQVEVFAVDLNAWLKTNEVRVDWKFPNPDAPAANVEAVPGTSPSGHPKPWLTANPDDPAPDYLWYTAARYFARQLVVGDSTLLVKKKLLAKKVATSLVNVGLFKRGKKKEPLAPGTVLKSFVNVTLK